MDPTRKTLRLFLVVLSVAAPMALAVAYYYTRDTTWGIATAIATPFCLWYYYRNRKLLDPPGWEQYNKRRK